MSDESTRAVAERITNFLDVRPQPSLELWVFSGMEAAQRAGFLERNGFLIPEEPYMRAWFPSMRARALHGLRLHRVVVVHSGDLLFSDRREIEEALYIARRGLSVAPMLWIEL